MTLFIGGDEIYARAPDGRLFNLDEPTQPLLMVGRSCRCGRYRARARRRPARRPAGAAG